MAPSVLAREGEVFVPGPRSADLSRELIAKAESVGLDSKAIRTVSHGYIVREEVANASATAEDVEAPADTDSSVDDVPDHKDETLVGSAPVREAPGTGPAHIEEAQAQADLFNPADHKVEDVLAYLDSASEEERTRVLEAEAQGKKRTSILPSESEGN